MNDLFLTYIPNPLCQYTWSDSSPFCRTAHSDLCMCSYSSCTALCGSPEKKNGGRDNRHHRWLLNISSWQIDDRGHHQMYGLTCWYFSKQVRVWLRVVMKYSVSLVRLGNPLVMQSATTGNENNPRLGQCIQCDGFTFVVHFPIFLPKFWTMFQ